MMGEFDDLVPSAATNAPATDAGAFADLIPSAEKANGAFDDLLPKATQMPAMDQVPRSSEERAARDALALQVLRERGTLGPPASEPGALARGMEGINRGVLAAANLPTTIHNFMRGAEPGSFDWVPPLEDLPRPQMPRTAPQDVPKDDTALQALAGVGNLMSGVYQGLLPGYAPPESGLTMPLLGAGGMTTRAILGLMAGHQLSQVPDQVRQAGQTLQDPNAPLMEKIEAVGAPVASSLFGMMMLHGTVRGHGPAPEVTRMTDVAKPSSGPAVSEFGGETLPTTPERPETLATQIAWLKEGKRKAVLLPQGEAEVVPEGMAIAATNRGQVIYDPKQVTAEEVFQHVKNDTMGELLGYGIERKPTSDKTAAAVTVRNAAGEERQAVMTDAEHLDNVVAAAKAVADAGDQVRVEDPAQVVDERVQTPGPTGILAQTLRDTVDARQPVPTAWLGEYNRAVDTPWALPEGYRLEGDRYVWQEPAKAETPAARQAREQQEAMAGMRQLQEQQGATAAETATRPAGGAPVETVERGMPSGPIGERPPDLLDEIEAAHGLPVRISNVEDYGEYLKQAGKREKRATGLASEILSASRGAKADEVLASLREAGYRRLETEDDLYQAMVRAKEARKGWAQQDQVKPQLEAAVDDPWQDTIDRLNSLKMDTTGQLHLFGLVPEAWNALIDLVKLGVRTGKVLADAVDWAITKFQAENPKATWDPEAAKAHLIEKFGERATGQKLQSSSEVTPEVKRGINEYLYEKRTNATDNELAAGLVQQLGLDGAEAALRNPPSELHGATWSQLLGEVTRGLAEQERGARQAGNAAAAEALAERQAALWDDMLPRITDMAQSLQGLNDLVDMSPDAQVARTRRRLDRAATEEVTKRKDETVQMQTALEQGRKQGLEELRQDPAVNEAARHAVDETITQDPEIRRGVLLELAEPWASSPAVLAAAAEQVKGKVLELMNRRLRPAGLSAAQHLRRMLDDMSERAASIFAGHIQGGEPGVTLVNKLMQRLGLEQSAATKLATALSEEWNRQLKAAQDAIPKRIARQRVARERAAAGGVPEGATDNQVDTAIRTQLRLLNVKLGEVLRQEAERRESTGQHVAERVVEASGLKGEKADTLRTSLENRWNAIVTRAQVAKLEALQRLSGVKVSRPMLNAFDRLVQLDRLGALTSERFFDVVKDKLKLKRLTQEDAAELRRLVQRAQDQPEGSFLRQQEAAKVLAFQERLAGNVHWWDVPMAIFYANILSGLTTPAKIVMENTNLLLGHTLTSLLARPGELTRLPSLVEDLTKSLGRGWVKGGLQAAGTLRSGVVSGVWAETRPPTVLEMKPFGQRGEMFNVWKWFGRVIGTSHELTFKPAWEVKQTLLARDIARREGLRGEALQRRVADLLANTDQVVTQAKAQALKDLEASGNPWNRLDLARRTREILEAKREENMPGSTAIARDFALRTAYLNEPYGVLGFFAKKLQEGLNQARKQFPVFGSVAKSQIPFTTVVANILNEKLNWTPVGLARGLAGKRTGELYGRPTLDPTERGELYAKAVAGTVAAGALAYLLGEHIHGAGPNDAKKRQQLQVTGWIPHSFEWDGRYYGYHNTPLAVSLAAIGNWQDSQRYGKGDEEQALTRLSIAGKGVVQEIVAQGYLDSVRRVFEAIGTEDRGLGASKLEKVFVRTGTSLAVPNLVLQVDRMFDPTVYDKSTVEGLLTAQIPWVRRENRPVLNPLGEPVLSGPFHYWASQATGDPVWSTLAQKQAWVPVPSRNQIVGDRKRGPDFYRAMTPDEYYDWIAQSGPAIRARLERALDSVTEVGNKFYRPLTDLEPEQAQELVRKVAEEEHAKARKVYKF